MLNYLRKMWIDFILETYLKWKNTALFVPSFTKSFILDSSISTVSRFYAVSRSVLFAPARTVRPSGPRRIMFTHYSRRSALFAFRDYITFVINLGHITWCCILVRASRDKMSATSSQALKRKSTRKYYIMKIKDLFSN